MKLAVDKNIDFALLQIQKFPEVVRFTDIVAFLVYKIFMLLAKNGNPVDVVLGYDTLEAYVSDDCYLGATIGRVATVLRVPASS